MPDTSWKQAERRVCRAFGGERRGPEGIGKSDCVETEQAVQIKYSKRGVPEGRWIETARQHGRQEGKEWVLVVLRPNQRLEEGTAVVRLQYLLDLISAVK